MKILNLLTYFIILCHFTLNSQIRAQDNNYFAPGNNNPVLAGFFADPSIVKMDGKYYIYATTVSKHMEPMVWVSDDLNTWEVKPLHITGEHYFWAPSMIKRDDGRYYLYYSSGFDFKCHLYIGQSPSGPFKKYGLVEEGFDLEMFKDPITKKIYGTSSDPHSRPRLVEFESNPDNTGYMTEVLREASIEGLFVDFRQALFPRCKWNIGQIHINRVARKIFDEKVYGRAAMNCKIFLPVD